MIPSKYWIKQNNRLTRYFRSILKARQYADKNPGVEIIRQDFYNNGKYSASQFVGISGDLPSYCG